MPLPQIPTPYIKFHFEGVVALCVAQDKLDFDAAVIKRLQGDGQGDGDIPNHTFSIKFKNLNTGEELIFDKDNMPKELLLDIKTQSSEGAQLFRPDEFDVEDALMHFGWTVGIEGQRMHKEMVGINDDALRAILRVKKANGGVFYTKKMSSAALKTRKHPGGEERFLVGTAEIVEAIIPLPVGGATLSKRNKATDPYEPVGFPFTHKADFVYEVAVTQVCNHPGGLCFQQSVADCYNGLITGDNSGRKISFVVDENGGSSISRVNSTHRLSPQTQCIIGNFEITQALPDPA